jgi:energy-coupling factor transporter ATP-binding protein EcfA2
MKDFDFEELWEGMEPSLKGLAKDYYKYAGWEIPWAVKATVDALWGKKPMQPILVSPDRHFSREKVKNVARAAWEQIKADVTLAKLKEDMAATLGGVLQKGMSNCYLPGLRTEYGWKFIFHLPPGYNDQDFLKAESYFYTAVGRRSLHIEIKKEAIFLHVMQERLKDYYPFRWPGADCAVPLMVGMTYKGPLIIDLVEHGPSFILWGPVGAGKSTLLRVICTVFKMARPDEVILIVIDRKGGHDFKFLKNHAYVLVPFEEIQPALAFLVEEMERRSKLLYDSDCENWKIYNQKHPEDKRPYFVVIVDEFAEVAKNKACAELLDTLIRLGRAQGICTGICSQRTTSDMSDKVGSIKHNCNVKMSFKLSPMNSRLLFDESDKASLIPKLKGRGVVSWGDELLEFQGMDLPLDEAQKIMAKLTAKELTMFGKSAGPLPPRQGDTRGH